MKRPIVAISMGDPAGIGPELVVKTLAQPELWDICHPLIIGAPDLLADTAATLALAMPVVEVGDLRTHLSTPLSLPVFSPPDLTLPPVRSGQVDPAMGEAAASCLRAALSAGQAGAVDAVVSAPMNKEAFHAAGYHYFDELAYLAEISDASEPFLMGAMASLWTIMVTEHIPFKEIVPLIRSDRILSRTSKLDAVLRAVGVETPRIAVAALNPHGGEGGLFGREEIEEIGPAVAAARRQGIGAVGPVPADTIFVRALDGEFDGVVCMYHDQANIARKLHPQRRGATLFMGLAVPWATTAHGTAFDIAGQGIADAGSLIDALHIVSRLTGASR